MTGIGKTTSGVAAGVVAQGDDDVALAAFARQAEQDSPYPRDATQKVEETSRHGARACEWHDNAWAHI